ncbi:MAG: hypothetical protein SOZ25_03870 [Prevotella sp.]|nr:hypothetical protein [Prevotella sp.]
MVTVDNQKDLISEFEKGNNKVMVTGKLKKRAKRVTKTMVFFHIIIVFIAFSRINFENLHIVYAPEILFALFILTSRPLRYWVALCICIGPQRIMLDEKSYDINPIIDTKADHIIML